MSVISLENPATPEEVAYYRPDDSTMWSAHAYKGRIYTNDLRRGFEALEIEGTTD